MLKQQKQGDVTAATAPSIRSMEWERASRSPRAGALARACAQNPKRRMSAKERLLRANGFEVRLIGRKAFTKLPTEIEIAATSGWLLVEVAEWSKNGWTSLKLFNLKRARKQLYQVGYKDGRMAKNQSMKLLTEKYPLLEKWIIENVEDYLQRIKLKFD